MPGWPLDHIDESARVRTVERLLDGGHEMRRDDDLLRKLMLEIEASPDPLHTFGLGLSADEDDERTYFHLLLLADEGFLDQRGRDGATFRMTMKGHDFIEAIRNDTIWAKTKGAISAVGGASISMMKDVALGYVRQELGKLGVPLG